MLYRKRENSLPGHRARIYAFRKNTRLVEAGYSPDLLMTGILTEVCGRLSRIVDKNQ
jgi:hypothetical protein